jgi:cytidine deaminase
MNIRQRQFEEILKTFPSEARPLLKEIQSQAGKLPAPQCNEIIEMLGIPVEEFMIRLLEIAALHAIVPISNFRVGAVAKASNSAGENGFDLYLGANIEFKGLPLNQSVHAEQAATINAWMQGATQIQTMTTSAAPCGHCRQFLNELDGGGDIEIITPSEGAHGLSRIRLSELLPKAFGPRDLNQRTGLMASTETKENLFLRMVTNDRLVLEALSSASQSYSPYAHNRSGCAIQTGNGQTYSGRYVENAAFNPSMSPLQVAVSCMNMRYLGERQTITRAVLVEKPSGIEQRDVTEMILKSIAPDVELEYYKAECA